MNNRIIQLNIIHQPYLGPNRLYRMGRMAAPNCTRCGQEGADFLHLMWYCKSIRGYWQKVVSKLEKMINRPILDTDEVCLIRILQEERYIHQDISARGFIFGTKTDSGKVDPANSRDTQSMGASSKSGLNHMRE